jgi:hypothetical protein
MLNFSHGFPVEIERAVLGNVSVDNIVLGNVCWGAGFYPV